MAAETDPDMCVGSSAVRRLEARRGVTELTFAIGEVAAMVGMSPHTIRAWERRHRALEPMRTASGQRRYTADDVEVLREIKRERSVHGLSVRVATLAGQGMVALEREREPPSRGDGPVPVEVERGVVRIMANSVSDLVVVLDEAGRIRYANTAFVRFADVLPARLRGVSFADFSDPFDRAKAVQVYRPPLRLRRGWELNLRGARQRSLYSFDCWPAPGAQGAQIVLIGREVPNGSPAAEVARSRRGIVAPVLAVPARAGNAHLPKELWPLLDGAPDPVRALHLFRPWLDATSLGVAMASARSPARMLAANRAFEEIVGSVHLPLEGKALANLWPRASLERLAAAIEVAITTRAPQVVQGWTPGGQGSDGRRPVWDIDVLPLSGVGGAPRYLLLILTDVSAEAAVSCRLAPLLAGLSARRRGAAPSEVLRAAAPHVQELVPNDGVLLALVQPPSIDEVVVVAASGRWAADEAGDPDDLPLALVRQVMRSRTPAELRWENSSGGTETHRIIPIHNGGPPGLAGVARVAGVIAIVRTGREAFTADDHDIIDEFCERLGLLLGSAAVENPVALRS